MCIENQLSDLLQLLRTLYPECSMAELKKKPVVLLSAYFDESGITDTEDACAIAGFVGSYDAQLKLKKNWTAVLTRFGVEHFHALDFYKPAQHLLLSQSNPYRNWSSTKRKKFISALFTAMKVPGIRLKAVGADAEAFRARTLEERRWLTGGIPAPFKKDKWLTTGKPSSPYHLIFRAVVENCCADVPPGTKIHFVMSKQDQMQANAIRLYDNMRTSFPQCQGASRRANNLRVL